MERARHWQWRGALERVPESGTSESGTSGPGNFFGTQQQPKKPCFFSPPPFSSHSAIPFPFAYPPCQPRSRCRHPLSRCRHLRSRRRHDAIYVLVVIHVLVAIDVYLAFSAFRPSLNLCWLERCCTHLTFCVSSFHCLWPFASLICHSRPQSTCPASLVPFPRSLCIPPVSHYSLACTCPPSCNTSL